MLSPECFAAQMSLLSEYFNKPLSDALASIYYRALKGLTDDQMKSAVSAAVETKQFMPKVVELIELVQGKPEDISLAALERLDHAVRHAGKYRSVDFEDKAINATIRLMGGWPRLCETDEDEWRQFRSREFQRIYSSLSKRPVPADTGAPLVGIAEAENLKKGHDIEPPMRIERRRDLVLLPASNEEVLMLPEGDSDD